MRSEPAGISRNTAALAPNVATICASLAAASVRPGVLTRHRRHKTIAARTAATSVSRELKAAASAIRVAVPPVTQPPQEKPTTMAVVVRRRAKVRRAVR